MRGGLGLPCPSRCCMTHKESIQHTTPSYNSNGMAHKESIQHTTPSYSSNGMAQRESIQHTTPSYNSNGMAQIESIQHTTPSYKSILALLIRGTTQFSRLLKKPTAMRNPKPHGILRKSLYLR